MRLIATMGASGIKHKHIYLVNDKSYKSELSFMALAEANNITDIVVIGTEKSKESIKTVLDKNPNIEMVVIESDNVEDVFQKSLEYISQDTILDLTQGYRHYPMLTLLASVFLQNSSSKNIKDIFYAQVEDENCQAYKESCKYRFTSLIKYLDIANMARIINTFNNTLLTLDYEINSNEFNQIKKGLNAVTSELFSNNFQGSKIKAEEIEKIVNQILEDRSLEIIEEHLIHLKKELQTIQNLIRIKESKTLLNVSKYFRQKGILLHSITLLYESMVAFLDEKINNQKCNTYEDKNGKIKNSDVYKRRNCLKLKMGNCNYYLYKNNIPKCQKYSNLLRKIDELRNTSAHAHTTGTYQENLKEEIDKAISFLRPIIGG